MGGRVIIYEDSSNKGEARRRRHATASSTFSVRRTEACSSSAITSSAHRLRTVFHVPFPQYCVTHAPCPVLVDNPEAISPRARQRLRRGGEIRGA